MGNIRVVQQWYDYDQDKLTRDTGTALVGAECNIDDIIFAGLSRSTYVKQSFELFGNFQTDVRLEDLIGESLIMFRTLPELTVFGCCTIETPERNLDDDDGLRNLSAEVGLASLEMVVPGDEFVQN